MYKSRIIIIIALFQIDLSTQSKDMLSILLVNAFTDRKIQTNTLSNRFVTENINGYYENSRESRIKQLIQKTKRWCEQAVRITAWRRLMSANFLRNSQGTHILRRFQSIENFRKSTTVNGQKFKEIKEHNMATTENKDHDYSQDFSPDSTLEQTT